MRGRGPVCPAGMLHAAAEPRRGDGRRPEAQSAGREQYQPQGGVILPRKLRPGGAPGRSSSFIRVFRPDPGRSETTRLVEGSATLPGSRPARFSHRRRDTGARLRFRRPRHPCRDAHASGAQVAAARLVGGIASYPANESLAGRFLAAAGLIGCKARAMRRRGAQTPPTESG